MDNSNSDSSVLVTTIENEIGERNPTTEPLGPQEWALGSIVENQTDNASTTETQTTKDNQANKQQTPLVTTYKLDTANEMRAYQPSNKKQQRSEMIRQRKLRQIIKNNDQTINKRFLKYIVCPIRKDEN